MIFADIHLRVDESQRVFVVYGLNRVLAYRALGATTVRGLLPSGATFTARIDELYDHWGHPI